MQPGEKNTLLHRSWSEGWLTCGTLILVSVHETMWSCACQKVETIEREVVMPTGMITRDAVSIWWSGAGAVTQAHPGSGLALSECNRWQKPEGGYPMVLIFRGLRSALRLPIEPTVCARSRSEATWTLQLRRPIASRWVKCMKLMTTQSI